MGVARAVCGRREQYFFRREGIAFAGTYISLARYVLHCQSIFIGYSNTKAWRGLKGCAAL